VEPTAGIWGAVACILGAIAGGLAYCWAVKLTPLPESNAPRWRQLVLAGIVGGLLIGGFTLAMLLFDCQKAEKVQPDPFWQYGRIAYHGILIWLLIAATITDLRDYVIPDQITIPGMALGILTATISGDLQMMHLWIDWNQADLFIDGAYIPDWIKNHHHLHGLAWSLAGLTAGAGLTWIVRWTSAMILGRQALGFGDVTLMAMIGSFIGWQPVVCVFLLAPICGIVLAILTWICTGRGFVPYGPCLAVATVMVLFTWRWIWEPLKETFGDGRSLAILGTAALVSLVVLLGILRFYWSIPVQSSRRSALQNPAQPGDDEISVESPPKTD
jgi:leader peptidase (prepilin peptidase)/N-methyltransferase